MRTRQELIQQILENVNAVGVGETPSADDVQVVSRMIAPKIIELVSKGVTPVINPEAIEDAWFDHLAAYIAEACGPSFGIARNPQQREDLEWQFRWLQPAQDGVTVSGFDTPRVRRCGLV